MKQENKELFVELDKLVFRSAVSADASALSSLARAAYREYLDELTIPPDPLNLNYSQVAASGNCFVYVGTDGNIIAMVTLEAMDDEVLNLRNLAVHPNSRNFGLGKLLVSFVEEYAVRNGFSEVVLWTRIEMVRNIKFYTNLGYYETHRDITGDLRRVFLLKRLKA